MFSEAVDDHPSLDEITVSVHLLSAVFNVTPLACLGFGFPLVLFRNDFVLRLFSAASVSFLSC